MSNLFDELINAGMAEVAHPAVAGEKFFLSGHGGDYFGVFRGEEVEVEHEMTGHDAVVTDALSVPFEFMANLLPREAANVSLKSNPPKIDERVTRARDGAVFIISNSERMDNGSYDMELRKLNLKEGEVC